MTCKQCNHSLLDHFLGRCKVKGCTCIMTCPGCNHKSFDHYLGFCSIADCYCISGHLIREVKRVHKENDIYIAKCPKTKKHVEVEDDSKLGE
jgi:hypothetical protein